ncbi:PREDICTED: scarecrow-like protein 6 isoform X2 [Ipomoea nil]|nr:PREDICTED: scarecrow-like protein 6 isoform X2 [Ipomoea nil]XP_019155189.1 PREDICTED: scarecrow-like protein 6 isoform X2 [Ipomoea nil]
MIGMQYNLQGKGVVSEVGRFGSSISASSSVPQDAKLKRDGSFGSNEPISVLDKRRSPSPSTSTSASSSSFGGTAVKDAAAPAAVGDGPKEEWVVGELQPLVPFEKFGLGLEDWECFLSESGGGGSDQSILRWVSGAEFEDPSFSFKHHEIQGNAGLGDADQTTTGFGALIASDNYVSSSVIPISGSPFSFNSNIGKFGSNSQDSNLNFTPNNLVPVIPGLSFQEPVVNQTQNPTNRNVFVSQSYSILQEQLPPPAKRQNLEISSNSQLPEIPLVGMSHGLLLGKQQDFAQQGMMGSGQKPLLVPKQEEMGNTNLMMPNHQHQQQQVVYDQIYKAAELILTGQFSHAQMILARLNHQLSPVGKSLQRAASYFKEALMLPLLMPGSSVSLPSRVPSPVDFVFKMGAYKVFSEASPILQFMNFTSNQALLEALGDAEYVHIFDFDIGFGAQWSSFMQELPKRNNGGLKITAFASPSTHHPLEISLMHESLTQFANDVGVKFELEVVNLDTFDPSSYQLSSFRPSGSEVVAVNFPIWSLSNHLSALPSLLHYIKQLSPKIVVSLERGCERTELPFAHHILNALKYYEVLFESMGAAKVTPDMANKMERFLFQPSIESIVQGRLCFPDQMPPWRTLFTSAGFLPVAFSNFTETQAECIMKRNQVRGFHVEKRQASLVLCWQRRELLTAMAWRC